MQTEKDLLNRLMESLVERILVRVAVFAFLQSDDYKLKILKYGGARPDPIARHYVIPSILIFYP